MATRFVIAAALLCFSQILYAESLELHSLQRQAQTKAMKEEFVVQSVHTAITSADALKIVSELNTHSQSMVTQALDELSFSNNEKVRSRVQELALSLFQNSSSVANQVQLYSIYRHSGGFRQTGIERAILSQIRTQLQNSSLSTNDLLLILNHHQLFKSASWFGLRDELLSRLPYKADYILFPQLFSQNIEPVMISDLIRLNPQISKYKNGLYASQPRLYLFCRTNRAYPCLILMRNKNGHLVQQPGQSVPWSQPALGHSKYNRSFNQSNGDTPSGVYTIDGVMPFADQQIAFGEYRRLILNFIEASKAELNFKLLLPTSSHAAMWWHEAVVARDVGRGLFRIHGTGLVTTNDKPYYPLVPTSGCVAQRENKYDQIDYADQRILLDTLMVASGMTPTYENEENLRGLLYVININSEPRAVTLDDLKKLGLF